MKAHSILRARSGLLPLVLLGVALSCSSRGTAVGQAGVVGDPTLTKHVDLGFVALVPFSAHPSGCDQALGIFCYDVAFSGTAKITAKIDSDVALSYDAGQLVGGGAMPFHLAYTPVPGASIAGIDIEGTATIDFT